MAARIVEWALRNRVLVIVLGVLLVAVGVEHMLRLPIDAVPDVTNVQVQVMTKAPALAPLDAPQAVHLDRFPAGVVAKGASHGGEALIVRDAGALRNARDQFR